MATYSRWVQCMVWTYLLYSAESSSGSDNTGTDGDSVDGGMLVDLGRRMRQPLLTLIGMAVRNQHPCSEWTQWSPCTATRTGYFGTRNRTRTCNNIGSVIISNARTEEDFGICEGFCPRNYNFTESRLCLKLYNMTITWDDAEKICQNDGGHLVYIDSDAMFSEIKKMLDGFGNNPWIDGRRKDTSSPWTTVHGVVLTKFYWYSGQPNNASDELCISLSSNNAREWHDVPCNNKRFPLCKIEA